MDILIIGNGFDLAHGLKTSYKDFLSYCTKSDFTEEQSHYKNLCKTNLWMKHFIARQAELDDTWIDLENEIYEVIKTLSLKLRKIFNSKNGQFLTIIKNTNDFNLLTIEKHLRKPYFGEQLSKDGCEEFSHSYIKNFYIESYNDLISLLYKHLREFTLIFEKYLINDVEINIDKCTKYQFSLQAQNKVVHVLSFNYTDTYERLYKNNSIYADPKSEYIYIHGKAKNSIKNSNLIFGTHSFYNYLPNQKNEEIAIEFNVFKKHNQRHKYGTIEEYQKFLNILTDHRRVIKPVFHVIGHSLDKTDHSILKHVFLAKKNAVINIYYHSEEAQEKLINNITDIIGEDEVMTKVRLIHQHDEKRGILRPKTKSLSSI